MNNATCPAVLIAAPASGQGKTTVTAALARLHARQGRVVHVFKCGPDFIDPGWLALASGRPVHNLDLWMTGECDARARLHAAASTADLVLVEGVMGLFDGQPSAADLAQSFGLPVLAVIDASAMAGTFGALAYGLRHYRSGLPWAGVLANRVASAGHSQMLEHAVSEEFWLGALMRQPEMALPERHLGLYVATEMSDALARLDLMADALAQTRLGQMSLPDWQRWRMDCPAPAAMVMPDVLSGRRIAVARDAAFCFIYQANLDLLQAMGAELRFFSPLADAALPDCDALWLPGGYPELHAQALAANHAMRSSIQAHVAAARPVWAECGGMMALCESLEHEGQQHGLWGVLPARVRMQKRLAALGSQQLSWRGATLRGHTFHYSVLDTTLPVSARCQRPGQLDRVDGEAFYEHGSVRASYFHAWFPSDPLGAAQLFL